MPRPGVTDPDATVATVEKSGGTCVLPKMPVPYLRLHAE